jgi:FkbM family methyltransferase
MAFASARHLIRQNRSNPIFRGLAGFCEKYLRAYYNQDYWQFSQNGEERVIQVASQYFKDTFIALDIGANKGEWTLLLIDRRPDARVLCFEIVPQTAEKLSSTFASFPAIDVFEHGLSNQSANIEVFWNRTASNTSSISPRPEHDQFKDAAIEIVPCRVERGDDVILNLNLQRIDLMKVDVEGHEVEVIKGFSNTLMDEKLRPSIIQFEYGATYLPGRHNLYEVYELLTPHGYTIGRIYPKGVEFKPYEFADDHFRMGNYIAVAANSKLESVFRWF